LKYGTRLDFRFC